MASTVLPNGIIIPEKFSRDWYADLYHNWQELDNLLGGGTPKDGTLTIQKNGDTVGTFSANQATDATANIEVPTKTSDLTNDSDFVQSSDLATVATSGSYTDLSDKPTIPSKTSELTNDSGFITSDDTKIPLAGSNAISGSLIPATTDAYDLGSPSYQWNNAYIKSLTINGVACGDILTHNVSEFVNVSSNQTIGGVKEFTDLQTIRYGTQYKGARNAYILPEFSAGYSGLSITTLGFLQALKIGNFVLDANNKPSLDRSKGYIQFATGENNGVNACILEPKNSTSSFLGTSTNKWKTLNGINPGALSLPGDTYINVDTTNWDLTCQNELMGSFTPTADGWLMLHVANSGTSEVNFWIIGGVIRINNKSTLNISDNNNFNMITIPVEKDVTYDIYGNASEYVAGRSISYCRFMPCRGNV